MLRVGERTSLKNENAVAMGRILGKEMLRADSAKGSSPDNYHIEEAGIWAVRRTCAGHCFVKTVADVTSKNSFMVPPRTAENHGTAYE